MEETIKIAGKEYIEVNKDTFEKFKIDMKTGDNNCFELQNVKKTSEGSCVCTHRYYIKKKPEPAGELTKRNIISLINTIKGETKPFHWHEDYKREVIEKLEKLEAKK